MLNKQSIFKGTVIAGALGQETTFNAIEIRIGIAREVDQGAPAKIEGDREKTGEMRGGGAAIEEKTEDRMESVMIMIEKRERGHTHHRGLRLMREENIIKSNIGEYENVKFDVN